LEHTPIKVLDQQTQKPVSFALVQNRMVDIAIVCNEEGNGIIPIADSTLIRVSAISYEDYFQFIIRTEDIDTIKVYLKPKTYELKELVVHPYPTRMLFKKAIVDLDIPDSNAVGANLFMIPNLKGIAEQSKEYQNGDVITIGFGSPISGIYNMANRRERSKRKLQKLKWNDSRIAYIQKRYNEEYVKQLLGLKKIKKKETCRKSLPDSCCNIPFLISSQ